MEGIGAQVPILLLLPTWHTGFLGQGCSLFLLYDSLSRQFAIFFSGCNECLLP